jgi:hypothetical protein
MAYSRGVSEGSILFYSGGHNHNGTSSALIATEAYSIYDFIVGFAGSNERQIKQQNNFNNLKTVISNVIKTDVLGPSGIRLSPNSIETIHIVTGAITAEELSANLVLVNNVIRSNNFDGTIEANGVISGQGSLGWAITSAGNAVFSNTSIRGTITADSLTTPGVNISNAGNLTANNFALYSNGQIQNGNFSVSAAGVLSATGATISGTVTASSVSTPGIAISNTGAISSTNFNVTAGGNITATGANISGTINASGGTFSGSITANGTISGGTISGATITAGSTSLYSNGQITNGNFSVSSAGDLSATGATITGILSAETGSRIGNFYFNNFGLTNGSGPGLSGEMQLDTFNNIIYAPFFKASDGQNKTEIKMGVIEMDRWGVGGPAQIRFNRERISPNNERYLAFALAGYQSGNVIGSINQTSATGVNYLTTSDSRLKINVDKPYDAIVVINTLIPRLYKWSLDDEGNEHLGFFAQELYEVYPDAVGVGIDASEQDIDLVREDPWGIDYSKITPLLTKAIQELCIKVEVLEQKVVELESN